MAHGLRDKKVERQRISLKERAGLAEFLHFSRIYGGQAFAGISLFQRRKS